MRCINEVILVGLPLEMVEEKLRKMEQQHLASLCLINLHSPSPTSSEPR